MSVKAAMRVAHPDPSHQQIIAELEGQRCQCRRRKAAGVSFCCKCTVRLPMEYYEALRFNGKLYDAAYLAAVKFLRKGQGRS